MPNSEWKARRLAQTDRRSSFIANNGEDVFDSPPPASPVDDSPIYIPEHLLPKQLPFSDTWFDNEGNGLSQSVPKTAPIRQPTPEPFNMEDYKRKYHSSPLPYLEPIKPVELSLSVMQDRGDGVFRALVSGVKLRPDTSPLQGEGPVEFYKRRCREVDPGPGDDKTFWGMWQKWIQLSEVRGHKAQWRLTVRDAYNQCKLAVLLPVEFSGGWLRTRAVRTEDCASDEIVVEAWKETDEERLQCRGDVEEEVNVFEMVL